MASVAGGSAHSECGGPGVGAIGMCFTGNFALTMMLEPSMLAPVLSQPSLPLNNPAGIDIAPDEVAAVEARLEREDLTVLAYRFAGDKFCMAQRFAAYAKRSAIASSGGCSGQRGEYRSCAVLRASRHDAA